MKEKSAKTIQMLLLYAIAMIILTNIHGLSTMAKGEEKADQWDRTYYTSKDGLYSYYVSKDHNEAKILYYEGSWDIKKLVIPEKLDGYTVTAIGYQRLLSGYDVNAPFHYIRDTVEEIILPDTITELDQGVFSSITKLRKVHLSDNLTELPDSLFAYSECFEEFNFPSKLNRIGNRVFSNTAIREISLPENITDVGTFVFFGCSELEKVGLPEGITSIPECFLSGTAIKEITIPDSVTRIEDGAFRNCKQLKKIKFSDKLNYIGLSALEETAWLSMQNSKDFVIINHILYKYQGTETVPIIPEGTIAIGAKAFNSSDITEITIPNTVSYIGPYAFWQCKQLVKVTLPIGLNEIGKGTFGFTALRGITIPDSVVRIGDEAFYRCTKLKQINFGSRLTGVGNDAFEQTPWLSSKTITDFIMVNDNILLSYHGMEKEPMIPEGTICIAGGAFQGKPITRITIPASVKYIGTAAFRDTKLENVYFEGDAPEIGSLVFVCGYSSFDEPMYSKVFYRTGKTGFDKQEWKPYLPKVVDQTDTQTDETTPENGIQTAIDATHFPDNSFREFVKAIYDINNNGYLSQEEIDNVTSLYYNQAEAERYANLMITTKSLKGIEYFTNLRTVNVAYSNISYIDFSKNKKLEEINADYCSFVSYNVSNCKKLKIININYSTFTKLDLRGAIQLKAISCDGSSFNKINLSSSKMLQSLNCGYCNISTLNLKQLPNLKYLNCTGNKMKSIDISANPKLETLVCISNQLTSIIIVQKCNLVRLVCNENKLNKLNTKNLTELEFLSVSKNPITSLDLSKNKKLKNLECMSMKLASLNLDNNLELEQLMCSNNQLKNLKLSNNKKLKFLYCSNNRITTLNLKNNNLLSILHCGGNNIKTLNLSNNPILSTLKVDKGVEVIRTSIISEGCL